MLLSVIVPTCNRPEQTATAIASIVSQPVGQPCEIIVVDDGSDRPVEVPSSRSGDFAVTVIRHETNQGPAAARNTGIAAARGTLVSFLDSDDELAAGTLRARLSRARDLGIDNPKGQHFILACGWEERSETGPVRSRIPRSGSSRDLLRGCWFAPGSCIIANTAFVRSIDGPYDARLRRLEDYDLFARLGLAGAELVVFAEIGAHIRVGGARRDTEIQAAIDLIRDRFTGLHRENRIDSRQLSSVFAYLAHEDARMKFQSGHPLHGIVALATSFRHAPRVKLYPGPGWDMSRAARA